MITADTVRVNRFIRPNRRTAHARSPVTDDVLVKRQQMLMFEGIESNDAALVYDLCVRIEQRERTERVIPCPGGNYMQHPLTLAILKGWRGRACVRTLVSFVDLLPEGLIDTLRHNPRTRRVMNECLWYFALVRSALTEDVNSLRNLCGYETVIQAFTRTFDEHPLVLAVRHGMLSTAKVLYDEFRHKMPAGLIEAMEHEPETMDMTWDLIWSDDESKTEPEFDPADGLMEEVYADMFAVPFTVPCGVM